MITGNASHTRNIQTYISCSRIVGLFSFRVHWNRHWLRHDIIKWINGTIVPLWDSEVDSKKDIWYSKQFDELATYIQLSQFEIGDRSRDIERTKQLWFLKEVGSTKAGFHCMLKIPHWFFDLTNTWWIFDAFNGFLVLKRRLRWPNVKSCYVACSKHDIPFLFMQSYLLFSETVNLSKMPPSTLRTA